MYFSCSRSSSWQVYVTYVREFKEIRLARDCP
jgi:hypothetical protein